MDIAKSGEAVALAESLYRAEASRRRGGTQKRRDLARAQPLFQWPRAARMSALASLAAYGDDDDDAGEAPSAPAVASSSSPKPHDASSAADTAAHTSAESHSAPSPPAPSQQSQAADAGAHERSRSLPSPVLQPSRTPSSFTSSISHLLPALPPPVTTSNPAIEVCYCPRACHRLLSLSSGQDTELLRSPATWSLSLRTTTLIEALQQSRHPREARRILRAR